MKNSKISKTSKNLDGNSLNKEKHHISKREEWIGLCTKPISVTKVFLVISLTIWGGVSPFLIKSRLNDNHEIYILYTSMIISSIFLLLLVVYILIDKSERLAKANKHINKTEALNTIISETVLEMITIHELDGTYKYLSPSCVTILGYTPEQLLGKNPYTLFSKDSVAKISNVHNKLFESDDVLMTTYKINRKDNVEIWLESSNKIIKDPENNKPKEILCISRDVTQQKNREEVINNMIKFGENLLSNKPKAVLYNEMLDNLMYLSKAKVGALTVLNEESGLYTTLIVRGISDVISLISKYLGVNIIGREWHDYKENNQIQRGESVIKFDSLSELSVNLIPETVAKNIESTLGIGSGIVIKITANGNMIGDFTLIMAKDSIVENLEFIKIYSRQIDMNMSSVLTKEKLIESENRLLNAQDMAHIGNFEINIASGKVWGSEEALRIYGFEENVDDLRLEDVMHLVTPEYKENLDNKYIELITKSAKYDEKYKIRKKQTGEECFIHVRAVSINSKEGIPYLIKGTVQDITKFKKAEMEVVYLSNHDQLTGLYNRRFYDYALYNLDKEQNLPLTFVMGDLNGLKLVNDSFGHKAGDELLIRAASIISNTCRDSDIVSRFGGDEFMILMPRTDNNKAMEIINEICAKASNERVGAITLSISFGSQTKTDMSQDILELLKSTEIDMYRHKLCESTKMRNRTVDLILKTLYEKNISEMLHSQRVGEICALMATAMNQSDDFANLMYTAGSLHDIGKIGIDNKILNKPKELIVSETKEMERHPEIGYRILTSVNELSDIAECVLQHHEKFDGTGYPRGLKGSDISLQARILSIADSFDAMVSYRSYKRTYSVQEAIDEIVFCKGTHFDPDLVDLFVQLVIKDSCKITK